MRVVLTLVLIVAASAQAEERPTFLACTANAKTWRDYGFVEQRWEGKPARGARAQPFAVSTLARRDPTYPLRDKIFSNLQGDATFVRSITPATSLTPAESVEFEAKVLLRTPDEVFLSWSNDVNKVWVAVVDLKTKKAVVAHVFKGMTSVGGELETLDGR